MSNNRASAPVIPSSANFDSSYSRIEQVGSLTDGFLVVSNGYIKNLKDPIDATDAATKQYVLDNATGDAGVNRTWKTSVRLATTTNITLSGIQTIDGVLLIAFDRVLVKNQLDKTQNGIYLVNASSTWSRTIDCPLGVQATGVAVFVGAGNSSANKLYSCGTIDGDNNPVNFGESIDFTIYGQSTPGGGNSNIQFNNNNVLDGSADLSWDGSSLISNAIKSNEFDSANDTFDVNMFPNHNAPIIVGSSAQTSQSVVLNAYGGTLTIDKSDGSNKGDISVVGATANSANIIPTSVSIQAGGVSNLGNTSAGSVSIVAGSSSVGSLGGNISIVSGTGSSPGAIRLSTGQVYINNTTNSTSTASGSLIITGGVGIGKTLYASTINSDIILANNIQANTISSTFIVGSLRLSDGNILIGNASNVSTEAILSGDASLANNGVLTLATVATPGTFTNANITIDAKGRITSATSGAIATTPGGTVGQLQYNNSGTFGGMSGWTYNGSSLSGDGTSLLIVSGFSTFSSLFTPDAKISNITNTNLISTNINTSSITTTNLRCTTATIPTLISSASTITNLSSTANTITNLLSTNINSTAISSTGLVTSLLNSTNINSTGITSSNLNSSNSTLSNLITTTITSTDIMSTNITSTNLNTTGLTNTNLNCTNGTITNLIVNSATNATNTSTGALRLTGGLGVAKDIHSANLITGNITATNLSVSSISSTFINSSAYRLSSGTIFIGNASNVSSEITVSGDASLATSGVLSLATVATPGSFTNASITIDAKGRVTSASTGAGSSGPGGTTGALQYNNSGAFAGATEWTYASALLSGDVTSRFQSLGTSTISNMISTNIRSTNITTSSLITTNLNSTAITANGLVVTGSALVLSLSSTTGTVTSLLSTSITTSNLNSSNILTTNITTTGLNATSSTISAISNVNLTTTNITSSTLLTTDQVTTNSTITNLINTNSIITQGTILNLQGSTGRVFNMTNTNLTATNATIPRLFTPSATAGTLNVTTLVADGPTVFTNGVTVSNLFSDNFSATSTSIANLFVSTSATINGLAIASLSTPNISATNITTDTLNVTSTTITNMYATTGTFPSLNASNLTTTNITNSGMIISLNETITNSSISSLNATNTTITNLFATASTLGNLNIGNSTITNLLAVTSTMSSLLATSSTLTNMFSPSGTFTNMNATNSTITILHATGITTGSLFAQTITPINLNVTGLLLSPLTNLSGSTTIANLFLATGTMSNINVTNSTITNLLATNITTSVLNCSTSISTNTLYVSDVTYLQSVYGFEYITYSDARLKDITGKIDSISALDQVCSLNSYSYKFKNSDKESIGYIAQEVEELDLDNVLVSNVGGLKAVNYVAIIPLLSESIKELRATINEQNKIIKRLSNKNEHM